MVAYRFYSTCIWKLMLLLVLYSHIKQAWFEVHSVYIMFYYNSPPFLSVSPMILYIISWLSCTKIPTWFEVKVSFNTFLLFKYQCHGFMYLFYAHADIYIAICKYICPLSEVFDWMSEYKGPHCLHLKDRQN